MEIVKNSTTNYCMVISEDASIVEHFAAEELQKYIHEISGVIIPIFEEVEIDKSENLIFVGDSKMIRRYVSSNRLVPRYPDDDSFVIKTAGSNLILTGCNERGTLYSIYAFLERLGCRWIEPGGYVIPPQPVIKIKGFNCIERPSFKIRGMSPVENLQRYTIDQTIAHIDWMCKNKMNWFCPIANYGWDRLKHVIVSECRKRGMKLECIVFSFNAWLPLELGKKHPEFFPLIDGRRSLTKTFDNQRCASNKEAIQLYVKNGMDWIRNNPGVDSICILPNDGYGWCQCEKCKNLLPKEQFAKYFDVLVKAVRTINQKVRLFNYVYYSRYELPKDLRVYKQKRVDMHFDTFIRCRWHPINSNNCNCWYEDARWQGGKGFKREKNVNLYLSSVLKKWRKVLPGDIYIFDNIARHSLDSTPFPNAHVLKTDARYFKNAGINGIITESYLHNWSSYAMEYYILTRIYWDVTSSVDFIIDDYCKHYYEEAWESVKRYFLLLEDVGKGSCHPDYWKIVRNMSIETFEAADGFLSKAMKATHDREILSRVRKQVKILHYLKLLWLGYRQYLKIDSCFKRKQITQAKKEHRRMLSIYTQVWRYVEENCPLNLFDTFCHQFQWIVRYLEMGHFYGRWVAAPKVRESLLNTQEKDLIKAEKLWDYMAPKSARGSYQSIETMELGLRLILGSIFRKIMSEEEIRGINERK